MNRFGATLTWEAPEYDGGSPITGYVIELRNRASIKWEPTMTTGADELSAVLTDVVENEEYFFRVRAQNMVGVGKPSHPTRAVKITDPIGKHASTTVTELGYLNIMCTGVFQEAIREMHVLKISSSARLFQILVFKHFRSALRAFGTARTANIFDLKPLFKK